MNSKSKLNELKNKLLEKNQKNNVLKEASENFNLDNKVDNFIDWYQKIWLMIDILILENFINQMT